MEGAGAHRASGAVAPALGHLIALEIVVTPARPKAVTSARLRRNLRLPQPLFGLLAGSGWPRVRWVAVGHCEPGHFAQAAALGAPTVPAIVTQAPVVVAISRDLLGMQAQHVAQLRWQARAELRVSSVDARVEGGMHTGEGACAVHAWRMRGACVGTDLCGGGAGKVTLVALGGAPQ